MIRTVADRNFLVPDAETLPFHGWNCSSDKRNLFCDLCAMLKAIQLQLDLRPWDGK